MDAICEKCEAKAIQYSMGFQDGFLTGKEYPKTLQASWESFNSYYKTCSNCKRTVGFDFADPEHGNWFKFCPNCGATMKEEEHNGLIEFKWRFLLSR